MRVENGNLIRSKRHLFPCFITVLYLMQVGRGWERRVFYWWWVPDLGGGGGGEGLLKTWIFRSATHMERGDDFELFCMRHCQLFERWIALFTGWISIHGIAQSIFWTTGAWSIKDYLYGQKKNIFLRANAGSPEWARWVHLTRWGSQSKHIFRFILRAHEFCHIIGTVKIEVTPQVHFA